MVHKALTEFDDTRHAHNFSMLQLMDVTSLSMGLKIAVDVMTKFFERNTTVHTKKDRRSRRTLTASQVFSSKI